MNQLAIATFKLVARFGTIWFGVLWGAALDMTILGVSGMAFLCCVVLDGLIELTKQAML